MIRTPAVVMSATLCLFGTGCSSDGPAGAVWGPGVTLRSEAGNARGLIDVRGIIHAHSVYSHDACDGEPEVGGVRNEPCFEDMRYGMCASGHDFVMLTDHPSDFAAAPYPDVLLYRPERGDVLVEHDGRPAANRLACDDGTSVLVAAGTESSALMALGIEGHVDAADRDTAYSSKSPAGLALLRDRNAVVLVAHTEDRTVPELVDNAIDGFEMFNLHAAALRNIPYALELIVMLDEGGDLPHSDLLLTGLLQLDDAYMQRWANVLMQGVRRVTVFGSDVHQNTLPGAAPDGERVDSYRRMMLAFSNHVLIPPTADGSWSDRDLKTAIRDGRVYGVFEVWGYPAGFDFFAQTPAGAAEMGSEVLLSDGPTLFVAAPSVRGLDPQVDSPTQTIRILKARPDGWDDVASGDGDLEWTPTEAGVYRVQVDLVPLHLLPHLGELADSVGLVTAPWILSNPIYVR